MIPSVDQGLTNFQKSQSDHVSPVSSRSSSSSTESGYIADFAQNTGSHIGTDCEEYRYTKICLPWLPNSARVPF